MLQHGVNSLGVLWVAVLIILPPEARENDMNTN
jgi:hypothetical protein